MSWDLDLDEASWFFGPGRGQWVCGLRNAHARWLSQWVGSWRWTNSQHRKIVSLSPRVENLNLKKVIKVSCLYQESYQCFVFFGFLCVWTSYEHYERFMHLNILVNMSQQPENGIREVNTEFKPAKKNVTTCSYIWPCAKLCKWKFRRELKFPLNCYKRL